MFWDLSNLGHDFSSLGMDCLASSKEKREVLPSLPLFPLRREMQNFYQRVVWLPSSMSFFFPLRTVTLGLPGI